MMDCHEEEFSASVEAGLGGCLTIPTSHLSHRFSHYYFCHENGEKWVGWVDNLQRSSPGASREEERSRQYHAVRHQPGGWTHVCFLGAEEPAQKRVGMLCVQWGTANIVLWKQKCFSMRRKVGLEVGAQRSWAGGNIWLGQSSPNKYKHGLAWVLGKCVPSKGLLVLSSVSIN